jgi:hypothetical protein
MKRITWFLGGVAAGATGVGMAKRRIQRTAAQFAPTAVAKQAVDSVRDRTRMVVDAVRDGRNVMQHREDELKARRDGRLASMADHLGPSDQVLVDGRPVEADRVVVMRGDR